MGLSRDWEKLPGKIDGIHTSDQRGAFGNSSNHGILLSPRVADVMQISVDRMHFEREEAHRPHTLAPGRNSRRNVDETLQ